MKASESLGWIVLLSGAMASTSAFAARQVESATLRDLQTVGATKQLEYQQYDFILDTSANEYTCRTKLGEKVKSTQFPIGSSLGLQINKQTIEVRNTNGNKFKCGIVRVGPIAPAPPPPPPQ